MITRLNKTTGKATLSRSTTITAATRKSTSKNSTYYKRVSLRNNVVIQGINALLGFNGFFRLAHILLLPPQDLSWLPLDFLNPFITKDITIQYYKTELQHLTTL